MAKDREIPKQKNMKKLFLMAAFAILSFGLASAFDSKEAKSSSYPVVKKSAVKESVISGRVGVTNLKKTAYLYQPREYASSCGTWTVNGSNLGSEQEQAFCNQEC